MLGDRRVRNVQSGGDASVGATIGHEVQDVALPSGEPLQRVAPSREELPDDFEVDHGPAACLRRVVTERNDRKGKQSP